MLATAGLLSSYLSPLTAQTPTAFAALRDSLAATFDTAALRTLLRSSRRDEKAHPEDLSAALRSGLLAFRLGELKADPDFSEALSRFREASRRAPGRPEPWQGLGLSETGRSRWEMSESLNLGSRVGLKALERAADNYRRALSADSTYLPAALALSRIELSLLDTSRIAGARDALRRTARGLAPNPPDLLLALGRLERAAGTLDSAHLAFERYAVIGPNRALGLLELARTRLALGRADGEAPYYDGAGMDDPDARAGYEADLQYLAPDSVMWNLRGLDGQARAAYLHRFWTDRDRLELRRDGERLREHYRRVDYARRNFALTISRRFYGWRDAYRSGSTEVDDRGIIYIRHGQPSQRVRPFIFGAMPNETWRYDQAEGDLMLHFSSGWDSDGGGDLYDYRLVQSVLDLRGAADAPPDQLLLSRQSLSPAYARMLNWGTYGAAGARRLERSIGRASIAVATRSDSYELQFVRKLNVVADLIAVGQRDGASLAHLVFNISPDNTSPVAALGGVSYPLRARLVILDQDDRSVARLDTTFAIRVPAPARRGESLVGRAEVMLPPGTWTYRASVQQGDSAGVVLPRDSVWVAPSDGVALSLSDIALGSGVGSARWVTDVADTVLLAPSASFRIGSDVEVYYEATGAGPGAVYRHEISLLRAEEGRSRRQRPPLVTLAFEERSQTDVIRSRRTVSLDRLKKGSYLVEVRVNAPDGSYQVRRRALRVTDK
ncbi:MAG TPA: GWxTD domain-containing protein [Gemmatimonadales bacterium]